MPDVRYQYTECGLDDVFLVNGFDIVGGVRGKQVVIGNIDGLHRAIANHLVSEKKELNGKEIRFLRHEMLMSQSTLARLLDVSEQAVHRWENGKSQVSKPASALIRLLYMEQEGGNEDILKSLRRIADLEDEIDDHIYFRSEKDEWMCEAA